MKKAIDDVLRYIRERTVEMSEGDYEMFLEQLKDEISRLQFLSEWTDNNE